jgi:hypothetical protein
MFYDKRDTFRSNLPDILHMQEYTFNLTTLLLSIQLANGCTRFIHL